MIAVEIKEDLAATGIGFRMSICAQHAIFPSSSRGGFFGSLEVDLLRDLAAKSISFTSQPGKLLFSEEQPPQKVFFILEGQVKLSANSSDGKRLLISIAHSGEVLGLASALNGDPYELSAETLSICRVAIVDRVEFINLLLHHPSAWKSAALSLSKSYNRACARFRTLSGMPPVAARVARLLLEFSATARQTKEGRRLHLTLTHQEIGECVGACRESVSRALSEFRRRKLITVQGSILTIRDRDSLERCTAISFGDRRPPLVRISNRPTA